MSSVGIDLKELEGSAAKMFEILPRDWNLKPIFTHDDWKFASIDNIRLRLPHFML